MSETKKEEIVRFVAGLKDEDPRITWGDIAERVQAEFPKAVGLSLTGNALRKRYNTWFRKSEHAKKV